MESGELLRKLAATLKEAADLVEQLAAEAERDVTVTLDIGELVGTIYPASPRIK